MIKYLKCTFTCSLSDDAILPPYKGSTFRGALGIALKKAVCALKNKECNACLLAERCLYSRIFEPTNQHDSKNKSPVMPHPYIIEPDLAARTKYAATETFTFNLILFGEFIDSLPYFIYAVDLMGEQGIGRSPGRDRARFRIKSVSDGTGGVLYDAAAKKITPARTPDVLATPVDSGESCGVLHIRLITPLRFKNDNRLSDDLSFQSFLRAGLRRVSAMHAAFGDGDPPLDYRGLAALAATVRTEVLSTRWHDWKRFSNRQHEEMTFGGILGNISYVGNIGPFMQIIDQARIMHIGKQTSFGLGSFDYRWEPDIK